MEIGEGLIDKLVNKKLVSTPADLYNLSKLDLMTLERMGSKSADNVLNSLNSKKTDIPLEVFLGSLCIPGASKSSFELLIENGYNSLEKIQNVSETSLISIKGIGDEKASAIVSGIKNSKDLIDNLLKHITIQKDKPKEEVKEVKPMATLKLKGKTFCATGKATMKRADLQKLIEDNGGTLVDKVNSTLDYLIIADLDSTSKKAEAARTYNTTLLTEDMFLALIK